MKIEIDLEDTNEAQAMAVIGDYKGAYRELRRLIIAAQDKDVNPVIKGRNSYWRVVEIVERIIF